MERCVTPVARGAARQIPNPHHNRHENGNRNPREGCDDHLADRVLQPGKAGESELARCPCGDNPCDAEHRARYHQRKKKPPKQVAAFSIKREPRIPEVRVFRKELPLLRLKEGRVQTERETREERAAQEELKEVAHPPTKGKSNPSPGQPAEAISTHSYHGQRDQEQVDDEPRRPRRELGRDGFPEDRGNRDEEEDRSQYREHFQCSNEEFFTRSMPGEPVALKLALADHVGAEAIFPPQVVNAQRDEGEEDVAEVDAEQRAPAARKRCLVRGECDDPAGTRFERGQGPPKTPQRKTLSTN